MALLARFSIVKRTTYKFHSQRERFVEDAYPTVKADFLSTNKGTITQC